MIRASESRFVLAYNAYSTGTDNFIVSCSSLDVSSANTAMVTQAHQWCNKQRQRQSLAGALSKHVANRTS
jgi:hypothetical protein